MLKMTKQALNAHKHLLKAYPSLEALLTEVGPIELKTSNQRSIEDAVVQITIGQMLSRQAAQTIWSRIEGFREELMLKSCLDLPAEILTQAGVSRRKQRTLASFRAYQQTHGSQMSKWPSMEYTELLQEIKGSLWDFSDWSIAMLAIFDFGFPDVFPLSDGTIQRALRLINQTY